MKKIVSGLLLALVVGGYTQASDACRLKGDIVRVNLHYSVDNEDGITEKKVEKREYKQSILMKSSIIATFLRRNEQGEPLRITLITGTPRIFDAVLEVINNPDGLSDMLSGRDILATEQDIYDFFVLLDYFQPGLKPALGIELCKFFNTVSYGCISSEAADFRQQLFNIIAQVNPNIFFEMSNDVAPLIVDGVARWLRSRWKSRPIVESDAVDLTTTATPIVQKMGKPFDEISYFVYKGVDEHCNAVVEQGLVKTIGEFLTYVPDDNILRRDFIFTKEDMLLFVQMFLGINQEWTMLSQMQKESLKRIFEYALRYQLGRSGPLSPHAYDFINLCIDNYPQLLTLAFDGGVTPLMLTINADTSKELLAIVSKMLVLNTEIIDAQDDQGRTALYRSAHDNNQTLMNLLLDAGANPSIKTHNGQTAITRVYGYTDARPQIIDRLPLPDVNDPDQRRHLLTSLDQAVKRSDLEAVKELLALGLHPNEFAPNLGTSQYDRIGVQAIKEARRGTISPLVQQENSKKVLLYILEQYPNINLESRLTPHINFYKVALDYAISTTETRSNLEARIRSLAQDRRSDQGYINELQERMHQPQQPQQSWTERVRSWWQNR